MKKTKDQIKHEFTHEFSHSFATGSRDFDQTKTIVYPFEKYEITVELTSTDQFVGIVEVKLNKDFRSYSQKLTSTKTHDVEEYYKDE